MGRAAWKALALVGATLLLVGCGGRTPITLNESGSTLIYPLFNLWAPAFHKMHPGIRLSTAATGSGTGIASAVGDIVQIGGSDAYMNQGQISQSMGRILNVPLALSSQVVAYNLPGLTGRLTLSGPVLARIYSGRITRWDDPALKALNPGVTLPKTPIVPLHRTDASGDSFIFTQYLAFSTPTWRQAVGFSMSPFFPPIKRALGVEGNAGMVQNLITTEGGVGYVGISSLMTLESHHIAPALLVNRAGRAVGPQEKNVEAAARALAPTTPPDERISLVFAPGAESYPIITYEYAIVNADQGNPRLASAVRTFLRWAVRDGSRPGYLKRVHFLPLPPSVTHLSLRQIERIRG